jgi:predicted ATPase
MPLRHRLSFTEVAQRTQLVAELLGALEGFGAFSREPDGSALLNSKGEFRVLLRDDLIPDQSILQQRKDPENYPELTFVGEAYSKIRLYREWVIGRKSLPRTPQKPDLPNQYLEESCANLALILNRLGQDPRLKKRLIEKLKFLYPGLDDFVVNVEGGTVQLFLHEGTMSIPATRLSDGTLRYLCLLAILCDPKPPPLICIEEPEIGLHPDLIHILADLLRDASERTQLIVTTHSDILVDALTESPEAILVCEKVDNSTTMRRLDKESLAHWLKDYGLGELWTRGHLGGTRW